MDHEQGHEEQQDSTEHHGMDASEKPGGGSKSDDNPDAGEGTGEGDQGLGVQTDAGGGGEPTEPGNSRPNSQEHPHGQSGR